MKFIALLVFIPLVIFISLIILTSAFPTTQPKAFASTARIDLLTADSFAVLGGSAISDVLTSIITGHVGLYPNGGASITVLTCGEVTGTIYDKDGGYTGACRVTDAGLLTTAKNDLKTAYDDAAGRTITSTVATDLAGATLTDGVYHAASDTFEIAGGGTLTLDGQGNSDAVFVFKTGTTLVTSSSSRVVLINSAQACNVYWQVGSSATLGTSTTLIGNILALTSITDDGSSTVNGRLLARNGAITLNKTTVTKQTCASSTPTPTPTPTSSSSSSSSSSSGGSSSSTSTSTNTTAYPALGSTIITPIIIESRRVDSDSIFIGWGPYSGVDTFNVQYGLENGKWLYNTKVTGFSTTLNALPSNQPIWVQIAADNGTIGNYGEAKLVGGPSLPNTGFAPRKNNIPWYIQVSIFAGILVLLVLAQKKHRFSSKHESLH